MSEWEKVHEFSESQKTEKTECRHNEYRRITDIWKRRLQKSVGIVVILDAYDSFEVRRCEEVFGITDIIKNINSISVNWEGGLKFSGSANTNVSTNLFDGRIIGRYETRDEAVEQAKSYIQSQS
jgi:hypothetical protein